MTILSEELKNRDKYGIDYLETKEMKKERRHTYERKEKNEKKRLENELFAREFINNGLDAEEAVKVIKPDLAPSSRKALATAIVNRKEVQERLMELLPSIEEDAGLISGAYQAKLPKDISWKDVFRYVELNLKLKGMLKDKEDKGNVNIALVVEN